MTTTLSWITRATLMLCALMVAVVSHATVNQPGTLDPFFTTGSPIGAGKVITPIAGGGAANAIALQLDGKVILAGYCNFDFCAARYNASGTLDATFGGGIVVTPVGPGSDYASAVVVQADGKVALAGSCGRGFPYLDTDFCALRYNANGMLDTSFGNGGKVITVLGANSNSATALLQQPDGKLVMAGIVTTEPLTSFARCATTPTAR